MKQLAIRDARATLPNLDATDLADIETLDSSLLVSDFRLVGAEMPSLEIYRGPPSPAGNGRGFASPTARSSPVSSGIPSLAHAVIDQAQVIQLGHALVIDLELRLRDD